MKFIDMLEELVSHNTLYIIRNGFDMHHNLHTGTSDYYKLLSGKRIYGSFDNVPGMPIMIYRIAKSKKPSNLLSLHTEQ